MSPLRPAHILGWRARPLAVRKHGTAWRLLGVRPQPLLAGADRWRNLSEAGAERPIIDGAANLEQKARPSPRPAHLLRFVHPAVPQKIGGPFRDRGINSLPLWVTGERWLPSLASPALAQ
jgi:hypothetical protein